MACCYSTDNFNAPNGDPVIITRDGDGNPLSYWDVRANTAWAGDPLTLVRAAGGQATVVDAGNNTTTITGTDTAGGVTADTVINNLLVNEGPLGTSRDIVPATDVLLHDGNVAGDTAYAGDNEGACLPDDGLLVGKNTDGDLVQQPPLVGYFDSTAVGITTITGTDLTAVEGTTIVSACASFTNNSCHDLILDGYMRTIVQQRLARNTRQDWFVIANMSTGPNHTAGGSWTGSGTARREQCATADCDSDDSRQIWEHFFGQCSPGETVEICVDLVWNGLVYSEETFNQLSIGSTIIRIVGHPVQGVNV